MYKRQAKAIGIDIDPQAIQASRDNAERNGVSDRLELYLSLIHISHSLAALIFQ